MDRRTIKRLNDRIRNSGATRVTLNRVDDSKKMQAVQVGALEGEVLENVERLQNYGFSSYPTDGEGIGLPIGGDRGQMVIVGIEDRGKRKSDLKPGEVVVYNGNGDFIKLGTDNKIFTKTKESNIEAEDLVNMTTKNFSVTGPGDSTADCKFKGDISLEGNLTITGNLTVTGDVIAGGVSLRNHTHAGGPPPDQG
jgi:phage baseplate assembly protein V